MWIQLLKNYVLKMYTFLSLSILIVKYEIRISLSSHVFLKPSNVWLNVLYIDLMPSLYAKNGIWWERRILLCSYQKNLQQRSNHFSISMEFSDTHKAKDELFFRQKFFDLDIVLIIPCTLLMFSSTDSVNILIEWSHSCSLHWYCWINLMSSVC